MGRHIGHTFVYLQDAVQDCRAITIQLLSDAQQGRQAVQVRQEPRQMHSQGIKRKIFSHSFVCLFYPLQSVVKCETSEINQLRRTCPDVLIIGTKENGPVSLHRTQ